MKSAIIRSALIMLGISIMLASARMSFVSWKQKYSVQYSSLAEHTKRKNIFEKNVQIIKKHNQNPNNTYKKGINQFTAYEADEVVALFTGYKPISKRSFNLVNHNDENNNKTMSRATLPTAFGIIFAQTPKYIIYNIIVIIVISAINKLDWSIDRTNIVQAVKSQGKCG